MKKTTPKTYQSGDSIPKDGVSLSVVTVVRNSLPLLRKTVQSVDTQSRKDFEYVIVDGNSTDGTRPYVLGQPSPANIVISEPDGGIYQAMNKAIGLCSGEYIQFLNAGDELFDSDTLAQAIPFLDGKSEIVIFGYSMHGKTYVPDISLKGMLGGMPCHQAIFYQREMLRHYPFDGGFRYCADFQHLLCAIFMQKIDLVDLVVVRYDTSGLTSDKSVMRKIRHERAKSALASDIPTAWKTSIALYNFIREVI